MKRSIKHLLAASDRNKLKLCEACFRKIVPNSAELEEEKKLPNHCSVRTSDNERTLKDNQIRHWGFRLTKRFRAFERREKKS